MILSLTIGIFLCKAQLELNEANDVEIPDEWHFDAAAEAYLD